MTKMTLMALRFLLLAAVAVTSTHARSSAQEMRRALNMPPELSHQRGSAVPVPQNVNIVLPANDPDAQLFPDMSHLQPVGGAGDNGLQMAESMPPPRRSRKERRKMQRQASQRQSAVPATQSGGRFVNNDNIRPIPAQPSDAVKTDCSFKIPSFLMPDPGPSTLTSSQRCPSFLLPGPNINPSLVNLMVEHWTGINGGGNTQLNHVKDQISQMEFEQKCLVPALHAHVHLPACRSRELTVYLEWLLYLRQRLFNI